jgi:type VI secretion system Hcp family effector
MGGALMLLAPTARAGVQGWLDFGTEAPGESTDAGHEGWAAVESFSSRHDAGKAKLIFHRKVDKASPRLMDACAKGKHFTEVKLDVAKTVQGQPVNFWELTLKEVVVSAYNSGSDDSGGATEDLTLEWKSLVFTYRVFPGGAPPYATTTIVSPDTDGDGLPDAYEESVRLDSAVSNLDKDADNDGIPDVVEYRLGTHPNDPTSFFAAVASMATPDTGALQIKWPSVAGEEYHIEYSQDLGTAFSPIASVTATSGETTYPVARTLQAGFFRVSKTLP